jgi:hypothetical protein
MSAIVLTVALKCPSSGSRARTSVQQPAATKDERDAMRHRIAGDVGAVNVSRPLHGTSSPTSAAGSLNLQAPFADDAGHERSAPHGERRAAHYLDFAVCDVEAKALGPCPVVPPTRYAYRPTGERRRSRATGGTSCDAGSSPLRSSNDAKGDRRLPDRRALRRGEHAGACSQG